MRSPFPGMDPYLEDSIFWQGIHNALITKLAEAVAPDLPDEYAIRVEIRTYATVSVDEREHHRQPDAVVYGQRELGDGGATSIRETRGASGPVVLIGSVPVLEEHREAYIRISYRDRDVEPEERRTVTMIELLSPTNKRPGKGRDLYLEKRLEVLATRTSLVEIDLIRSGDPMPLMLRDWPPESKPPGDYRILVARGWERPRATLHAFTVRDTIPPITIPLDKGVEEPTVDLGEILHRHYDTMRFHRDFDYRREPIPPFETEDEAWADELLKRAGLR